MKFCSVARSQIMEAPVSPTAHIISSTMPDGPSALPVFIWEIAFLTISMVIGMDGPSIGGSSDRCGLCPSQSQHSEAIGSALTRPSALSSSQYSCRPPDQLLDKHDALHVWQYIWPHCILPYSLNHFSMPWKLFAWLQLPFPHAHFTTRFHDANGGAELCHIPPQLSWADLSWCGSRYPNWQHQLHLQRHSHASWRLPGNCLSEGKLPNLSWGVKLRLDFSGTSINKFAHGLAEKEVYLCGCLSQTCTWWVDE